MKFASLRRFRNYLLRVSLIRNWKRLLVIRKGVYRQRKRSKVSVEDKESKAERLLVRYDASETIREFLSPRELSTVFLTLVQVKGTMRPRSNRELD